MPTVTDDDLMALVAGLRPRPQMIDEEFPPARRAALIADVRQRGARPAAVRYTARRRGSRRLPARRPLAAAAGLVVAAAVTVVVSSSGGQSSRPIPAALDQLAATAARTTSLPVAGRQRYLYREQRITDIGPTNERDGTPRTSVTVERRWTRGDGDQYSAGTGRHFEAFHFVAHGPADYSAPSRTFLAGLPTSPRTLYAYLERHVTGGHDHTDAVFNALRDMLVSGVPTPQERAVFIRALGLLPRVKVTQKAVDPSGHPAVRVRYRATDESDSLYFDAADSHITAEVDLWNWHKHHFGTWTVVLRTEVVDRPPASVVKRAHRVG
jgi:hypothetical protein